MKLKIALLGACALISSGALAQEVQTPVEAAVEAVEAAVERVAESPKMAVLPTGTSVTLSMDNALATDKREKVKGEPKPPKGKDRITNVGDSFTMTVTQDVVMDGTVVIPKGTRGFGEVTMVSGRGGFGKSGKIEFKLTRLEMGGKSIAMEGTHLQKGKGRGGAAIAGTIIAGAIAGAFIKGDEADVAVLSEWTFTTAEEISFKTAGN